MSPKDRLGLIGGVNKLPHIEEDMIVQILQILP